MIKRRSFLTHLGAGVTGIGATAGQSERLADGRWQPARHPQDDWLDKIPGKHRFVFDTIVPDGFGHALLFANNYYIANQNGYGIPNSEIAVVIIARHYSTVFAFSDTIWSKYGSHLSQQISFTDPKTKEAPKANLFNATGYGAGLSNSGVTLNSLITRGAHLAVCQMATRAFSTRIARAISAEPDAIYNEIAANLVPNAHLAAAGILAVNRAQERGYSFVYA